MLRLCLTLSSLFGLLFTGAGANKEVDKFCKEVFCLHHQNITNFGTYEMDVFNKLQWVMAEVSGTDMESAIIVATEMVFEYARGANDAGAIVPVAGPLVIQGNLVDGKIQEQLTVSLLIPFFVLDPPQPTNPAVTIVKEPSFTYFMRTFHQKNYSQDIETMIDEFVKDLEKDGRHIESNIFYIALYNQSGLMQIIMRASQANGL